MENSNLSIGIYKQKYQGLRLRFEKKKYLSWKNIQMSLFVMSLFYDKDIVHKSKSVNIFPSKNW